MLCCIKICELLPARVVKISVCAHSQIDIISVAGEISEINK